MFRKIREIASRHIQGNLVIYFIVIMFLLIGISAGAFTVKALSDAQRQELIGYLRSFFQFISENTYDTFSILKQSLLNNIQTGVLIWLLGITIVGIPFILLLIALRGFIIGFTVGFLVEQMGIRGLFFALCAILPQNLLIIPCLVSIAVIGISFSLMIIKNKLMKSYKSDIMRQFVIYSTIVATLFSIILLGALVEAYITPIFMKFVSSYMQ
ncbi:stage II sporulation protein M [Anaerosolibacter carboniphilus]|uniref:Stage II sporulation protein M n=1 Tax=Anaerosolibacter carboniphilus TaxID=1417629 RepID=A0A841KXC2_9FIRM|nr:stage II sporulation protein M [Anaerosolibacter carboniphilus]MBB6216650.1 stage II sporulation protein M [Anaerosolibacter carboniphilus]